MAAITENNYSEEVHPWNFYIPQEATRLFVGTFPTERRNRRHDFFYSSSTNRFWEVMFKLTEDNNFSLKEKDEVQKRKLILDKLKLGVTDMGKKVLRQQGSSNDHSLFPIEFMDILEIMEQHPTINTIIVTGNSQGNSSLSWFAIFCAVNNIPFEAKKLEKEKSGIVRLNSRIINIKATYSPSRLSRVKTEDIIEHYRAILFAKNI